MTRQQTRITPAYAGTTSVFAYRYRAGEDHPRLRGNHALLYRICRAFRGSPPLTREPLNKEVEKKFPDRITPAYAGTTIELFT